MVDMTKDAVFLPGKVHGCEDEIYIVYLNPEANNGNGCFEIGICDYETILRLYEDINHDIVDFFEMLPDYFQGKWCYCNAHTEEFDEYAVDYEKADFIVGRDGDERDEFNFIIEWALSVKQKEGN